LASTKVIVSVVTTYHLERVVRLEPFIKPASWRHAFPVEITFTPTKYVHIELGLEGMEVMNLWVVVGVKGKASHIAES